MISPKPTAESLAKAQNLVDNWWPEDRRSRIEMKTLTERVALAIDEAAKSRVLSDDDIADAICRSLPTTGPHSYEHGFADGARWAVAQTAPSAILQNSNKVTKTTSSGFEWFEIQPGYWQDQASELIWGPEIGKHSFTKAQEKSVELNDLGLKWSVPTKEEWLIAEVHNIREVLDLSNKWFWSSSPYNGYAPAFWGNFGEVYSFYRDYLNMVRCVGR
jgi:hypothetical protein